MNFRRDPEVNVGHAEASLRIALGGRVYATELHIYTQDQQASEDRYQRIIDFLNREGFVLQRGDRETKG